MRSATKKLLEEAEGDQLLDILGVLLEKYPYLAEDIEYILHPKTIKNPQSYYNKLVKKAIDTNSWSHFPNKGVRGLEEMVLKIEFLEKVGNILEAKKLALAVLNVIARTKKNYNNQNQDELRAIKLKLAKWS